MNWSVGHRRQCAPKHVSHHHSHIRRQPPDLIQRIHSLVHSILSSRFHRTRKGGPAAGSPFHSSLLSISYHTYSRFVSFHLFHLVSFGFDFQDFLSFFQDGPDSPVPAGPSSFQVCSKRGSSFEPPPRPDGPAGTVTPGPLYVGRG